MRATSLRRRLVEWLLPPLLALIAISAAVAYGIAVQVATRAYDRSLLDPALAVANHVSLDNDAPRLDLSAAARDALLVDTIDRVYIGVVDAHDRWVAGSHDLPLPPAPLHREPQFYDSRLPTGARVRVVALPVLRDGERVAIVLAAETQVKRDRLVNETLVGVVLPSLGVAVLAVVVIWLGVARGLAPLLRLSEEMRRRSPLDLSPLPTQGQPAELRPLVAATNELLLRMGDALAVQQRFVANAAHQLRTPLAGLLAQTELLAREPAIATDADAAPLRERVERLRAAAGDTSHLAHQLLTLARADPREHPADRFTRFDLRDLGDDLAQRFVPAALARRIDLGFELEDAPLLGERWLVQELASNLIDNAIKYTPEGGVISVRTRSVDGRAELEVEDNGIGIPASAAVRVQERFYRVEGTPGEGSGLGLAIVREIAEGHGAEVVIAPGQGRGTRITVSFPAFRPPSARP
ncbi:sensor histidine kinase [Derxia gummosa]|uniref:histidine kinase n=1 Tax=Derxia gummosa DSM 723 TaxID=1121388 RepID=A0A8B6X2J6_9BURK|nr:sensor histidine kinase [Derxia gummosa]